MRIDDNKVVAPLGDDPATVVVDAVADLTVVVVDNWLDVDGVDVDSVGEAAAHCATTTRRRYASAGSTDNPHAAFTAIHLAT